jgi:hypothetical protein
MNLVYAGTKSLWTLYHSGGLLYNAAMVAHILYHYYDYYGHAMPPVYISAKVSYVCRPCRFGSCFKSFDFRSLLCLAVRGPVNKDDNNKRDLISHPKQRSR